MPLKGSFYLLDLFLTSCGLISCLFCSTLANRVKELVNFPNSQEEIRVVSGLKWIGLFSNKEKVVPKGNPVNLLDTLCARLEKLMKYERGEQDLVMLQHKFLVEWKDGSLVRRYIYLSSSSIISCLFRTPSPPHSRIMVLRWWAGTRQWRKRSACRAASRRNLFLMALSINRAFTRHTARSYVPHLGRHWKPRESP